MLVVESLIKGKFSVSTHGSTWHHARIHFFMLPIQGISPTITLKPLWAPGLTVLQLYGGGGISMEDIGRIGPNKLSMKLRWGRPSLWSSAKVRVSSQARIQDFLKGGGGGEDVHKHTHVPPSRGDPAQF